MDTRQVVTVDHPQGEIAFPRDVFLIPQDGVSRLFDFHRGQFLALDQMATEMLMLTLEHGSHFTVQKIAAECDVPRETVSADLDQLITSLERKGLMERHPHSERSTKPDNRNCWKTFCLSVMTLPLRRFACGLTGCGKPPADKFPTGRRISRLMTLTWISLRILGFRNTMEWFRGFQGSVHGIDGADTALARTELIVEVDAAVRRVAAGKLLFPSVCKERAIVGWQLLRGLFGLPATVMLGLRRHPFMVHAWVECEGHVVTDDPEHTALYQPLAEYC